MISLIQGSKTIKERIESRLFSQGEQTVHKKIHLPKIFIKIEALLLYCFFFITFFISSGIFWESFVAGKLYYCSDELPFINLPPFVHSAPSMNYGDYWIGSPTLVYTIWIIGTLFTVFVPLFFVNYFINHLFKEAVHDHHH